MDHAIFVRSEGVDGGECLATDIATHRDAVNLMERLAGSYSEHGTYPGTEVCWFRDREGLKEMWSRTSDGQPSPP